MAGLPGLSVGVDEGLDVVTKSMADVENGAEVCLAQCGGWGSLVDGASDLVEVAADGIEFGDAAVEGCELVLRERRQVSQMGADEERNVVAARIPLAAARSWIRSRSSARNRMSSLARCGASELPASSGSTCEPVSEASPRAATMRRRSHTDSVMSC